MSYRYETQRPALLTEEGSRAFIKSRDAILTLARTTGCIRMGEAMPLVQGFGNLWEMMAVLHRMVEIGDLLRVDGTQYRAGQHEIFEVRA